MPQKTTKWSTDTRMVSCDSISVYPYLFQGTVFLKEGLLVMVDPMNAGEISVLDLQTNQVTHYSMTDSLKGINPALLPFSFYHSDRYSDRYYHYRMENGRLKLTSQSLRFRGETTTRAVQLNKNNYAISGFFRRLIGLYNIKSKEMDYFGHYPLLVDIPYDRNAKDKIVQSFQGNIAYSEKHSNLIYCSGRYAYLSCYKFTGRKLKFEWERHIIPPPEVSIINGFLQRDSISLKGGFSDVAIGGDYIFACYSQNDTIESVEPIKNCLMVFNMKGETVASYLIDFLLSAIAVDLERKSVYGIVRKDDPSGFAPFIPIIVQLRFDD